MFPLSKDLERLEQPSQRKSRPDRELVTLRRAVTCLTEVIARRNKAIMVISHNRDIDVGSVKVI